MAIVLDVTRSSPPATVFSDVKRVAPKTSNTDVGITAELPASIHLSYTTIAVPVCKRGNSSTKARSPKNRRLNTETASATAVVKQKDILDVTKAAKSSHP